jgi:transcriptional regulator of aroF, aroG, tyrA and aromatic amino acid transport
MLLTVLDTGNFKKIGTQKEQHVDVRMIFATNANLDAKIRSKEFREDLFYRINDVIIRIPPLRERLEDIPELCRMFLKREKINKTISESALMLLRTFPWKGNIRQLEKCIKNAALLYCSGDVIEPEHLKL